jgi:hypothetical protein
LNSEEREREKRDALMDWLIHLLVYPLTFDHREGERAREMVRRLYYIAGVLSYVTWTFSVFTV